MFTSGTHGEPIPIPPEELVCAVSAASPPGMFGGQQVRGWIWASRYSMVATDRGGDMTAFAY